MSVDLIVENIPSRLSFSRYWESRECLAAGLPQEALNVRVSDAANEPDPKMLIGRFYHSLVRAVAYKVQKGLPKENSLIESFPEVAQAYSERYPSLNLDYDPIVQRIYDTVRNDIQFFAGDDTDLYVEVEIRSGDALLFGTPDWVLIRQGSIQLIDFKLTTRPESLLSDRNKAQLAFYSYLVMEAYGQPPSDVQLVGLDGATAQVRVSLEEANQIAEDAHKCQRRLSHASIPGVSLEDLASPSPMTCSQCRYREICGRASLRT